MRISDWSSDVCSSDLIAIDPSIGRRRRIGREVRPIAAVIAQIDLASLIAQPRRRIRLGAQAERPFRDAVQAVTRNITVRRTVGAAGKSRQAWRTAETDNFGTAEGATGIGAEATHEADRDTTHTNPRPPLAGLR